MANTYTQIHIHAVVAVKFRSSVIMPSWKERLQKYITGIVQNNTHKMLSINSMPDHLHLFFGFRPVQSLSDLMRMVKGASSEWINNQKLTFFIQVAGRIWSFFLCPFAGQNSLSIHKKPGSASSQKTFLDEYKEFLRKFEVEYIEDQYIFQVS